LNLPFCTTKRFLGESIAAVERLLAATIDARDPHIKAHREIPRYRQEFFAAAPRIEDSSLAISGEYQTTPDLNTLPPPSWCALCDSGGAN
jgi:hypothetical protein